MKRVFGALTLAALILMPVAAQANDGNAATSASGQKGLFNLIYGENLCHGQWAFSTYYNKWDRRVHSDPDLLVIDPLWTDWDMDVERASVAIGYGLTDRVELSVMLPYWSFDGEDIHGDNLGKGHLNGRTFEGRIDQQGIGNLRIGAKFNLTRNDTYATALMAYVDAPTGDDDESVVTGDTGLGLTFAYNNIGGWVLNLGYFSPGDSDFGDVSDEVQVGLGYGRDITDSFEWITELAGTLYTDSNGEHDNADITSGGRWRLSNPEWAFNAGLRVDLSDTSFDYTPIGGVIGLSYSPKNRFSLTVEKDGSGTGSVSGDKIDCGNECSAKYHCGATVELTATPDPKSRFDGWEGDCAGTDPSVTITLDGDKTCTAKFVKLYDLTVEIARKKHADGDEPGDGFVRGDLECRDSCTITRDVNTEVNLEAVAAKSSTFGGWSVDCSGDENATSVTLSSDKTCVATFVGPPRPCVDEPIAGAYTKCGRFDASYSCDSETWTQVVEGYAANGSDLPAAQQPSDQNEKKTALCEVVNFLRQCSEFKACVAGREQASEKHCTAEERAAKVAGFFNAQADYPFFKDIAGRVQMAPNCQAEGGSGQSVEIFLDK